MLDRQIRSLIISIHAPAKGATKHRFYRSANLSISIHAPAKGATVYLAHLINKNIFQSTLPQRERRMPLSIAQGKDVFQSTLPQRERRKDSVRYGRNKYISIHAPAKGATLSSDLYPVQSGFQSTLPQRERRDIPGRLQMQAYFNPRSRKGSDVSADYLLDLRDISIHAPAKGATSIIRIRKSCRKFQSTLPQRERPNKSRRDYCAF